MQSPLKPTIMELYTDIVNPSLRKPFFASRWSSTSERSAIVTYTAGILPIPFSTILAATIPKLCTFRKQTRPPTTEKQSPVTTALFLPSLRAIGHATTIPTAVGIPPTRPSVDISTPEVCSGFAELITLSNIHLT